jgi:MerR family transcriptional regulator, light-induced transcriptional regulator
VTTEPIELQAAADQLGVHYQTAYKWVRSGRLAAQMINGRYMIDQSTLDAFANERKRPTERRPRRPRSGFSTLADRMFQQLVLGDERGARKLSGELVTDGVPLSQVIQEVIAPALRRIGEEWRAGRMAIWVEHQASAIVERILGEQHPTPRGRRRGVAMVAAVSGDSHSLPTSMAAAALREDNWAVHHLGADIPGDEIVRFCAATSLDLAVLTVTTTDTELRATCTATELQRLGLRTIVGHPGGTLEELQRLARGR